MNYSDWIEEFITKNDPHNLCSEATEQMIKTFPELTRIRGHVITVDYGEKYPRPHWWLVTPNGQIIDPTATQWTGIIEYQPYDESLGEPTGKCANCGNLCYNSGFCCSDKCHKALKASLDNQSTHQE